MWTVSMKTSQDKIYQKQCSIPIWQLVKGIEHCCGYGILQARSKLEVIPKLGLVSSSKNYALTCQLIIALDLHVEWLKCHTWARWWKEEVILVDEKMWCSIQFCD